jgi:hypothetical protein
VPGATVYTGCEEVLRYFSQFDDAPGNLHIDGEEIIAASDNPAIALLHLTGSGRVSGVPLDLTITHLYRLDDDLKAVEVRAYLDPHQALKAVGLEK